MRTSFPILLAILLFSTCRTPPAISPSPAVTTPADPALVLRLLKEERFVPPAGQWKEFKYTISISQIRSKEKPTKEKNLNAELILRWLPDSVIWVSIHFPPAGEIVRAKLMPDFLGWYDRSQKTAYILQDSTHTLASLLLRTVNSLLARGLVCDSFSSIQLKHDTIRTACIVALPDTQPGFRYLQIEQDFAGENLLPVRAMLVSSEHLITVTFAHPQTKKEKDTLWCPELIRWRIAHKNGENIIEFSSGKCKLLKSFNAPFKIPEKYEVVNIPAIYDR